MSIFSLTLLDWFLIGVLLYSLAISAYRGFVREIVVLVSVVAGILLASWFHQGLGALLKDVVRTENLALFFGFFLIFIGTLAAGAIVGWLMAKFMKFAGLEWFDRLLGAAFGLVRGWLIGVAIFLGLTAFDVQAERVRNSRLAPLFLPGSRVIAVVAPFELKAKFLVGYREVERWWREH